MTKMAGILIVDDDVPSCELLQAIFEDRYTVRYCHSGEAALRAVAAEQFDLVILDARLPDVSGFDVCRQIKLNSNYLSVPVMFLSGLTSAQDRAIASDVGAAAFISKPFDVESLEHSVGELIHRYSGGTES